MDVREGGSFDDWAPGRTEESTFVKGQALWTTRVFKGSCFSLSFSTKIQKYKNSFQSGDFQNQVPK